MYFLTFNDQPSGIYQSQVIDVVKYFNQLGNMEMTLIAFLPLQGFKQNKRAIRSAYKKSLVIPMIFGISRWKKHQLLLKIFTNRKRSIITRGPLANALSLGNFKRVVYDGRAAVKAEVEEYDISGGNKLLDKDLIQSEENAVLKSDFRIAVSHKLVEYWKQEFKYSSQEHVVIPCTLNSTISLKINEIPKIQNNSTIKVVYSGSTSGWQSFDKVVSLLKQLLEKQSNVFVLFLTQEQEDIKILMKLFPDRVERKFVSHEAVHQELIKCDYGILIRDNKITNQVASPVKFAEYLNAGLQVLISPNIGDFSTFVKNNNCGIVVEDEIPFLNKVNLHQREYSLKLVKNHFYKESTFNMNNYIKTLDFLK